MLELRNITKDYITGQMTTHALKGVSLSFRRNEFVSILGTSGCGKTTLLNIIGGLDRYTDGDLLIKGKSTKQYKDRDWDTYRNHSIGFIFQSYNLIMHQNICRNVELALTIGGVSRKERHERAVEALTRVGLGEVVDKMPNQLSGGQMQRVAIARALVNNPEILLADEPTGALDSETSVQIMELLKEIASDRLVIMVTHNPDLAKEYSTRIVRLNDGLVVDDSMPVNGEELAKENEEYVEENSRRKKEKKSSMSFLTALALSFKNLLSKKGRTILTGVAGSIGIIGIALILSLSDGFNEYIGQVESDALSEYPLTISQTESTTDTYLSMMGTNSDGEIEYPDSEEVSESKLLGRFSDFVNNTKVNNLKDFKAHLESQQFKEEYSDSLNAIKYTYALNINVFSVSDDNSKVTKVEPLDLTTGIEAFDSPLSMLTGMFQCYTELIDNEKVLLNQYDVLKGHMPKNPNEVVVMVDKYNRIDDLTLFALGLRDKADLLNVMFYGNAEPWKGTFDQLLGLKYKAIVAGDYYTKSEIVDGKQMYNDLTLSSRETDLKDVVINKGYDLEVVGVIRQKQSATSTYMSRGIGYTSDLTQSMIARNNDCDFVKDTLNDPNFDHLGYFTEEDYTTGNPSQFQRRVASLEVCDIDSPSSIRFYPKSFNDKDKIISMISKYNASRTDEKDIITYTDTVAVLMSSVTKIVNSVTYVLIAFVSISLIVSSIMIGIITYVSVIERTKEIGVLRSLGASKNDVSNVFNAETLIVGALAGSIGVGFTLILIVPINAILLHFVGIANLAFLRWYWCLALIGVSMLLTFIAGLIPSRFAAKRDPVIALRSGD